MNLDKEKASCIEGFIPGHLVSIKSNKSISVNIEISLETILKNLTSLSSKIQQLQTDLDKYKSDYEIFLDSESVDISWSFWTPNLKKKLSVKTAIDITHTKTSGFYGCWFTRTNPSPDFSNRYVETEIWARWWRTLYGTLSAYTRSTVQFSGEIITLEEKIKKKTEKRTKLQIEYEKEKKRGKDTNLHIENLEKLIQVYEDIKNRLLSPTIELSKFINYLNIIYEKILNNPKRELIDFVDDYCELEGLSVKEFKKFK